MSWLHHHGADGECHDGPGGIFGCAICQASQDEDAAEDNDEDSTSD